MTTPGWGMIASLKGPQGDTGATGTDGKTILNGSGTPSGSLGVDGDFYIDTVNNLLYGPKISGAWGTGVSLVGPQGEQGPAGEDGAGIAIAGSVTTYSELPTDLTSADSGKAYLVEADGLLYIWTGSAFPADGEGVEFKGDPGVDGKTVRNGTGAPPAALGVDGDFYVDTSSWDIYGPKTSGAWGSGVSLVGPQGETGETGATGADGGRGATWFTGSGAPTSITGEMVGDLYLDKDSGIVYKLMAG